MGSWFYRAYQFLQKNRIGSAIALALFLAGLVFLVSKISFEEDISKLIPSNTKTKEIQKVLKTVNFTDKIIVNIQRQPNASVDELTQYASAFVESVESNSTKYIKNIQGKVGDEDVLKTLDFVYENLPLFLEVSDYKTIEGRLQKDSIAARTQANYRTLISPSGFVSKKTILKDPLGLSFLALQKMKGLGVGKDFVLKDGFLLSQDEQNILLFISPVFESSETAENSKFAEQLYGLQKNLNQKFAGKISSEFFGAALIAVANAQQIKRDIQFTVGIAFTLLILIFIFFYRKIWIPIILFVPTLFGGLLAVALLYFLRGEISAISLGIGSVLLGVTLDYSLHILTHIRNNETVESLFKDVTQPILMSSLTTALAFLCLLFLNSQALQDLGIFAAISVLGASAFALLFIPLVYKNASGRKLQPTVFDKLASYKFHKNKWLLLALIVGLLISAFTYQQVVFEKDISKLNYESNEMKTALQNLDAVTDISAKSIYLATYGKSAEGTLQLNDSIFEKLSSLKSDGKISSFSSIGALVHSQKEQREKIGAWNEFWNAARVDSLQAILIESGSELGFKPTTFNEFYILLDSTFEPLKPEAYQKLPAMVLDDFISTEADITTITTLVKLNDKNASEVREIFKSVPNTLLIDRQEMNEAFLGTLKDDFNHLFGYCLLVVLLILYLFFRSFSLTLVTALPIFLTWLLTIGMMGVFGIKFNIFNIIISTFIFGLGVDYSIFITKGLLKELQTGEADLKTHKTSIILSVITTILGVGVLVFAKHPALYSISVVSIIGIFSAMLVAFTVQPLLFTIFIGSSKKRPVSLRMFVHSVFSFGYFGLGGILLSIYGMLIMPLLPFNKERKLRAYQFMISKYLKSVLQSNPFVRKTIINEFDEDFSKPAILIANHTSFLDVLAMATIHPKLVFLVNDWVYNSPIFGKAVRLAGFYPVSDGIENGVELLREKVAQGYSLMAFPEGTRSQTHKIKRFHKGAFYLAEQFNLDILPVLIHGNSEINPKGSFIIKDGSLTLKILPRINPADTSFGETYSQRAKKVGGYFRETFAQLRKETEGVAYFHKIVIADYRYKGNTLYKEVKTDLQKNAEIYFKVLSCLSKSGSIIHLSEGCGQLDFLLALDGPDRKIVSFVEKESLQKILFNSYITKKYKKLQFIPQREAIFGLQADTLIVSSEVMLSVAKKLLANSTFKTVVLLGMTPEQTENIITLGFQMEFTDVSVSILKKKVNNIND